MRELGALVLRHLREILRGREGRRQFLFLLLAALLPALALSGGPSSALWASLALLGVTLLGIGAASGQRLPSDREGGRAAWLSVP